MSNICEVQAIRKRTLLLVPVVTLTVAMVTYQTWRPFDLSALVQAHFGNQNGRLYSVAGTSAPSPRVDDDIGDVRMYRANSTEAPNDVINVTKIVAGSEVVDKLNVSKSGGKTKSAGKEEENCRPKSNIAFLKTHKTASSTVQNILMRYGLARNLTFVLPYNGHILSGKHFSKSAVLQERFHGDHHGNRTVYNILCHHTRFHYDNIRELMPNDTVYVTIVRNPVDMFESSFYYYRLGSRYNISQPNALKTFLDNPSHYVKKFGEIPRSHNALFYDLGYDSKDMTSEQTIRSTIDQLDRIFSVVMVSDYFEESVILLKHALCWDIDDVTFFKINARNETSVRHVTAKMAGKIRQWNKADVMLFDHFNKTLWSKLSRLPQTWRNEVEKLRERNLQLTNACVESDHASRNELDKAFQVFQPKGISIDGIALKDGAKDNTTCWRMATPELPFTRELQRRERSKLNIH